MNEDLKKEIRERVPVENESLRLLRNVLEEFVDRATLAGTEAYFRLAP
jgi:hypothetical protein